MRQFYEHIRVDAETLRFCTHCPICDSKRYGAKIPMVCRSVKTLARCVTGTAGRLSQWAFNRAKANATQQLAIQFNQCRHCYRWVCDGCYDSEDSIGACRECSQNDKV